jgi:hypothetical protein
LINEIIIKGSKETTFHDFAVTTSCMNVQISPGEYWRSNQILFSDAAGGSIVIPTTSNMNYDVCLMTNGETHVLQYSDVDDAIAFYENGGVIDKIAWFTVGENVTSLDDIQINVVKTVIADAS